MKLSVLLISIAVLLLSIISCSAQTDTPNPAANAPNPGAGMMSGMSCPMCGSMMGGGGQQMSHHQMLACLRAVGLSDDQMRRLLNIFLDYAKVQARLSGEIKVAQIDAAQRFLQDDVDRRQVESQVQQMSRLQGDLQLAGVRALLDAREVLTPAQRRQLVSMMLAGTCPQMPMPPAGAPPPQAQH